MSRFALFTNSLVANGLFAHSGFGKTRLNTIGVTREAAHDLTREDVGGAARSAAKSLRRQSGLTLVELMVAIAVGIILVGGLAVYFGSQSRNYRYQQAVVSVQENARTALLYLSRDLRRAGRIGCTSQQGQPTVAPDPANGVLGAFSQNILDVAGLQSNTPNLKGGWELAVMGQDDFQPYGEPLTGLPPVAENSDYDIHVAIGGTEATSDKLYINTSRDIGLQIAPDSSTTKRSDLSIVHRSTGLIPTKAELDALNVKQGAIVAVTDCAQAAVFKIRNAPAGTGLLRYYVGNDATQPNADLQHIYGSRQAGPAELVAMERVSYFLDKSTGAPEPTGLASQDKMLSLFRSVEGPAGAVQTDEIVEGVDAFTVTYAAASACDVPIRKLQYQPATATDPEDPNSTSAERDVALAATARAAAVRIELELRAPRFGTEKASSLDSDDQLRQSISTVVELRNGCL